MACSWCMGQVLRVAVLNPSFREIKRPLSTTCMLSERNKEPVLRKWGLEDLPPHSNSNLYAPLVELPDFTYLDGRPTPLTKTQLEAKERNYKLAKRIVTLTQEMEEARAAYAKKLEDEKIRRETIISSKLKQKSDEV